MFTQLWIQEVGALHLPALPSSLIKSQLNGRRVVALSNCLSSTPLEVTPQQNSLTGQAGPFQVIYLACQFPHNLSMKDGISFKSLQEVHITTILFCFRAINSFTEKYIRQFYDLKALIDFVMFLIKK